MTITEQRLELKAEANSLHALEQTARRADDAESMLLILEKLTHCYRLQVLTKQTEQQESGWEQKLPTIEPLSPVMSAEEFARRIA